MNAQFTQKGFSHFFYLSSAFLVYPMPVLDGSSLILILSASNLSHEYLVIIYEKELMGGCRISWWLWFPIFEIALPVNVGLLKFILKVYPVSSHSCQWFLPYPPASPLKTKARIDLFSQKGLSLSVL